ncbi:hypothetical protein LWC35_16225 [Pseudonocardia kujensis]|uniref:Rv1733c family protein n=1 Tax=Pseudonocardia kujensis TaxID=1128675 RepID=UPI001E59B905|nr:hypothetical protein [Pseudonocardia kujensis]MCE0764442.1 hypothetical protein [Pseudonocardia kujensis]
MAPPPRGDRLPRRRSDRLADLVAWVFCALTLVALGAALVVGLNIHSSLTARAVAEARDRTPLTVVVAEEVPVVPEAGNRIPADVRWTGPDGVAHTARTEVAAPKHVGDQVSAWITADGRLVRAPLGADEVVFVTITSAGTLLLVGGLLLAGVGRLAFAGVARLRAAEWAREWAEVEPRWTGRASTG